MSQRGSVLPPLVDRHILTSKTRNDVGVGAFAFLFSEIVQYSQTRVSNVSELERKLADVGFDVGVRMLELLVHREKAGKRENRILGILSFLHTNVWKNLFGKTADSLERGTSADDEYMISDHDLLVNRFISVPRDMGHLNCGAFAAGIVEGVLKSSGFPARVTAHSVTSEGLSRPKTTILIKFSPEVIERDERLGS
ncbi:subunit 5 of trafficking protein particle complex [Chloropicon roscoffensis]|uniref:Trafficking protein particle complex subunit n=1 Tax=Chloropicon roscoffensis TaxID=1461544 RepID=A0AAX4P5R2_9CHLO